jgi:hypothetical protein
VLRWALAGALRSPSDLVHALFVHCPPCSTYCISAVCTLYSCQQKDCCSSCHQCVPRHQHRHRLFMSSPGLAQAGVAGYGVVRYCFGFYNGVVGFQPQRLLWRCVDSSCVCLLATFRAGFVVPCGTAALTMHDGCGCMVTGYGNAGVCISVCSSVCVLVSLCVCWRSCVRWCWVCSGGLGRA